METKCVITKEQFESLEYFRELLDLYANNTLDLTRDKKSDIEYGFALGMLYYKIRKSYTDMAELLSNINTQTFIETEPEEEKLEKYIDPEQTAIDFTNKKLKPVKSMLSDDYLTGFKEGIERYIEEINKHE